MLKQANNYKALIQRYLTYLYWAPPNDGPTDSCVFPAVSEDHVPNRSDLSHRILPMSSVNLVKIIILLGIFFSNITIDFYLISVLWFRPRPVIRSTLPFADWSAWPAPGQTPSGRHHLRDRCSNKRFLGRRIPPPIRCPAREKFRPATMSTCAQLKLPINRQNIISTYLDKQRIFAWRMWSLEAIAGFRIVNLHLLSVTAK